MLVCQLCVFCLWLLFVCVCARDVCLFVGKVCFFYTFKCFCGIIVFLSFWVFVWGRSVASLPTVSLGCPNQSHQLTTDIAPFALFFSLLFFLYSLVIILYFESLLFINQTWSESFWMFFLGSGQFLLQSYMMEQVQWYESKVCFDSGPYKVIYCNLVFIYILIQRGLEKICFVVCSFY